MFIYSGKTPMYIPMPHSSGNSTENEMVLSELSTGLTIVAIVITIVAFIIVWILTKDTFDEVFCGGIIDFLIQVVFCVLFAFLVFCLMYVVLGAIFLG